MSGEATHGVERLKWYVDPERKAPKKERTYLVKRAEASNVDSSSKPRRS